MLLKPFLPLLFLFLTLVANESRAAVRVTGENILSRDPVEFQLGENKKAMVIVFLSAKCPCSNSHGSEFKSLAHDYPDFDFVGIHSNQNEPNAREYFEKAALPFVVIEDKGFKLADQYKAFKTPHAFVINRAGETLYQGGVSDSKRIERADKKYLRMALAEISIGKKVSLPEGRTLGCEISRAGAHVW